MLDCLIKNGIIVPVEPFTGPFIGYIGIKNGRIALIERGIPHSVAAITSLDANDQVLIPGFVNAHLHPTTSMLRGLISHLTIKENDSDPFVTGVYANVTEEDAYYAAMLTLLQALRSGTTSVGIAEYLSNQASLRAMGEVGLFGSFAMGIAAGEEEVEQSAQVAQQRGIKLMLSGPDENEAEFQVPFLLSQKQVAEQHKLQIHMHIQETQDRVQLTKERYGRSTIALLADIDLLPQIYAVHCTILDPADIDLLAKYQVPVIVTPSSEALLGDGVGPVKALQDAGVVLGLGTDGCAWAGTDDMFVEMRSTGLLNRAWGTPKDITSRQLLEMATIGGAKAMGIGAETGSLTVGKRADITFIDTRSTSMHPLVLDPKNNIIDLLAYSVTGADVSRVMIAGKTQYQRGASIKEQESILSRAQKQFEALYLRAVNQANS